MSLETRPIDRERASNGLVGRDAELDVLDAFAGAALAHGAARMLVGEGGIGKSALLEALTAGWTRRGIPIVQVVLDVQSCAGTRSGLQTLIACFSDWLDDLAPAHADALRAVLDGNGVGHGNRLILPTAIAMLLGRASPVLVLIDGVHHLDDESIIVLGSVARRLGESGVGILAAARPRENLPAIESLAVHPLDKKSSEELLTQHWPELAAPVRRRILEDAAGNPLALTELPMSLSWQERAGIEATSSSIPLSARLSEVFSDGIAALPCETRDALLVLALDDSGALASTDAVFADPTLGSAVDAAERAGLVVVDAPTRRWHFSHALTRSALITSADQNALRVAHAQLAIVLTDRADNHVLHLAASTVEPNFEVAALIDDAAQRLLWRGNPARAAMLMLRASELSTSPSERQRRRAQADRLFGFLAGQPDLNVSTGRGPEDGATASSGSDAANTTAYVILSGNGDVNSARWILLEALRTPNSTGARDPRSYEEGLTLLAYACWRAGLPEWWDDWHALTAEVGLPIPRDPALFTALLENPLVDAPVVLNEFESVLDELVHASDPRRAITLARAAVPVDRTRACRPALLQALTEARSGESPGLGVSAAGLLAWDDFLTGDWTAAEAFARESIELAGRTHAGLITGYQTLSLLAAARGDGPLLEATIRAMGSEPAMRDSAPARWWADHARTLAALGTGDYQAAQAVIAPIPRDQQLGSHLPYAPGMMLDLIEAAIETHRTSTARKLATAIRTSPVAQLSSRLALLAIAACALCEPADSADVSFKKALSLPEIERWPFDLARVRLTYGRWLRGRERHGEAATQLLLARDTFERLGASPWADQAGAALRPMRVGLPHPVGGVQMPLSDRERQIAGLAAQGLTNKQIGGQLYLSPRTVGAHLHRLFPKLGVSTRAGLRDALRAIEDDPTDEPRSETHEV